MSAYIGLDPSLGDTGYSILRTGKKPDLVIGNLPSKPEDYSTIDARLAHIVEMVDTMVQDAGGNALVILEGLSFASNMPSSQERAALHYMVRANLIACNRSFILVPPSTLKKFVTDTGAAKKELMLMKIYQRYGVETANNNIADAVGLAYFGASRAGEWDMLAGQAEVMEKYKAGPKKKEKKKRK